MSWKDKKTNVWVLEKIGTDLTIRRGIMERKLNYFGHIVRRSEGVEKQILQGAVEGKRGRGRPPISWTDNIVTKFNYKCSIQTALVLAQYPTHSCMYANRCDRRNGVV